MLVSTKGRYALRIMIDLAEHQRDGYIPLKETVTNNSIFIIISTQIPERG